MASMLMRLHSHPPFFSVSSNSFFSLISSNLYPSAIFKIKKKKKKRFLWKIMNIAQEFHLYFWFTQLFYFPNQREAKGCICICFNNRSVGISGFWRRIITLLVEEFFYFIFGVEMRDEKEREWCAGSSLEMGTGILMK